MAKTKIFQSSTAQTAAISTGYGVNGFERFCGRLGHSVGSEFFLSSRLTRVESLRSDDDDEGGEGNQRDENTESNRASRFAVDLTPELLEKDQLDYLTTLFCVAGGRQSEFAVDDGVMQYVTSPVNRWGFGDDLSITISFDDGEEVGGVNKFDGPIIQATSVYDDSPLIEPALSGTADATLLQRSARGFNHRISEGTPISFNGTYVPEAEVRVTVTFPLTSSLVDGPFTGTLRFGDTGYTIQQPSGSAVGSGGIPGVSAIVSSKGPRYHIGDNDVLVVNSEASAPYLARELQPLPALPPGNLSGIVQSNSKWFVATTAGVYELGIKKDSWNQVLNGTVRALRRLEAATYALLDLGAGDYQITQYYPSGGSWQHERSFSLDTGLVPLDLIAINQTVQIVASNLTGTEVSLWDLAGDLAQASATLSRASSVFDSAFPSWNIAQAGFSDVGYLLDDMLIATSLTDSGELSLFDFAQGVHIDQGLTLAGPSFVDMTGYPAGTSAFTTPLDTAYGNIVNLLVLEEREDKPIFHALPEVQTDTVPAGMVRVVKDGTDYLFSASLLSGNAGICGVVERNNDLYAVEINYITDTNWNHANPTKRLIPLTPTGFPLFTLPTYDSIQYNAANAPSATFKSSETIDTFTYFYANTVDNSRISIPHVNEFYFQRTGMDGNVGTLALSSPRFHTDYYTNWDVAVQLNTRTSIETCVPAATIDSIEVSLGPNGDSFSYQTPAVLLDTNMGEHCVSSGSPDLVLASTAGHQQEVRVWRLFDSPTG